MLNSLIVWALSLAISLVVLFLILTLGVTL